MPEVIIHGPVTAEIISARITESVDTKAGGHSIFPGRVRPDIADGRIVTAIEYSAYEPMAVSEADKLIEEIRKVFSDVISAEIIHSTGLVKAGEISLFVMVSAGHCDQAIRACRQPVELVKERLPVWKKELYSDNTHRWKDH